MYIYIYIYLYIYIQKHPREMHYGKFELLIFILQKLLHLQYNRQCKC